jgi:hypothetical protein
MSQTKATVQQRLIETRANMYQLQQEEIALSNMLHAIQSTENEQQAVVDAQAQLAEAKEDVPAQAETPTATPAQA